MVGGLVQHIGVVVAEIAGIAEGRFHLGGIEHHYVGVGVFATARVDNDRVVCATHGIRRREVSNNSIPVPIRLE